MDDTVNGDDLCEKSVTVKNKLTGYLLFACVGGCEIFSRLRDYCGPKDSGVTHHFVVAFRSTMLMFGSVDQSY